MYVSELSLNNFRSYESLTVSLNEGRVSFVGSNGQGKTNLVEAIDYVATLSSHRVSSDTPLIRQGAEYAQIKTTVVKNQRKATLEVDIMSKGSNKVRVNGANLPRTREIIGILRTVLFSPDDLELIKGDPAKRRQFLDNLLVLQTPRLAGVKTDYEKVVKQRNALLKTARLSKKTDLATLDIWDEQLSTYGAQLMVARINLLINLLPFFTKSYAEVAAMSGNNRQNTSAHYVTKINIENPTEEIIKSNLLSLMEQRRSEELIRGVSLVGPHRDDVDFQLGDLPVKGYSSHGETWSYALALKLAAFELLRQDGDDPVLILDDVFAELDRDRRAQLAELVSGIEQVITTTAVSDDVPAGFANATFIVNQGTVKAL